MHNGLLIKVSPKEHIQRNIFWYGYYEKEAILTLERMLPQKSNFIDIGANIGYYSIVMSKHSLNVYAFEPSPKNLVRLEENIAINCIKNIHIIPNIVAEKTSLAKLYLSDYSNTGMTGLYQQENFSGKTVDVNTIVIDDWIAKNNIENVGAIKIDIEGYELNALKGMIACLQKFNPIVFIEINEHHLSYFNHTIKDIYDFFHNLLYTPYEVVDVGILKEVKVIKEADIIIFIPSAKAELKHIKFV